MTTLAVHRSSIRTAYAPLAVVLAALAIFEATRHGGWWQLAAFVIAPDLALLLGISSGLARGRLHPRAVPAYNAVHRFWGPVLLVWLMPVAALAWATHVAADRALGYGLRTRDGFQRS